VRQALIAGVIDELTLDIAPVLLGSGERIFDGVESFGFEPVEVLHSPLATHIRYRRRAGRGPAVGSSTASNASGSGPSRCCIPPWRRTSATAVGRAEGRRSA